MPLWATCSVRTVRCPFCTRIDDKVVDSRSADDGTAIRRRRECLECGRRFTTFERIEEVAFTVIKRNGTREGFDRSKVLRGLRAATKGGAVSEAQVESVTSEVEERLRLEGTDVSSQAIGLAVLERLEAIDPVAYLRFASVYKNFTDPADFAREASLLTKATEPKPAS